MSEFINNKYTRWYFQLIEARIASPIVGSYNETHHIIPESFFIERTREGPRGWLPGNPDATSNLVSLTAREHFICHWLLTKMTSGLARVKMLDAIMGMRAKNKNQPRYKTKITSRVYARLKEEYSLIMSERMSGDKNPQWGRVWTDEEKSAQADKVRGDKNGAKKPGASAKIADSKRGKKREKFSQEWVNAMSDAKTGEKNNMWGKTHSEETKALQSEQALLYGWITDGVENRRVLKTTVDDMIANGWSMGRTLKATGGRPKTECPHCGKLSAANTYTRFHGDKCKHKK